ncbi:MAG: 3-phenylpropionate/trans-cinnamate dioxygenase ferredoxin reductase subunit [Gammaproteobacteria bacterium]|jgi:3-phenylpropionate/trans-cinnamate dioxygenase ferredoxin reductase subunit
MDRIVIVGGGQAAGQAAASLRQEGFEGELVLFCDESRLPYQRPPLSKQYLSGEIGVERVQLRPEKFYADNNVTLRLGERVVGIEPDKHTIELEGGVRESYDKLILATGSRVRRLDQLPGATQGGIHYLRTVDDADGIRTALETAKRVVVVGGGYIGLEVASVAVTAGASVVVLEAESRLLARVATEQLASFYTRVHREHGVDIRTNAMATNFAGDGQVRGVVLSDGTEHEADMVVVGVGIVPNIELAEGAGIACDNGITVDEYCRTSAADVLAAGDCTSHPSALLGRNIRLESVPNAMEQARVAAAAVCGTLKPYTAEPWFWSDQYDLKLQMAGFADGADEHVTRGDPDSGAFITFHLRAGVVVGADAVNSVREFLACRKLVATGATPDLAKLADTGIPVKELVG